MATITIDIPQSELSKVARATKQWADDKETEVSQLIAKYILMIERSAKKRAPVNKIKGRGGILKARIHSLLDGLTGYVMAGAEYSKFQEFGTGRRGASSGIIPPSGYEYGTVAGVPPQPFMFPAYEQHRASFIKDLKAILRRL